MRYIKPLQKIPEVEKTEEWGKQNVDYWSSYSYDTFSADWERMMENYLLNNNVINQERFRKICDPLGLDSTTEMEYVQPYNKLPNKINVLIGEENKRPFNFSVKQINPEVTNEIIRKKQEEQREYLEFLLEQEKALVEQKYGQVSPEDNQKLQEKEQELLNLEQIEQKYKNYTTDKEHILQILLKMFVKNTEFRLLTNESFYNALIAGIEAGHVYLKNNQLKIEVVNPLGLIYHKSPEEQFLQNGDSVGYIREMSIGDVIDRYGKYLKEDELDTLSKYGGVTGIHGAKRFSKDGFSPNHWENRSRGILRTDKVPTHSGMYGGGNTDYDFLEVATVYWRSWKKVGFLQTINEYGDEELIFVDDKFPIPKYATKEEGQNKFFEKTISYVWDNNSLVWEWVPQIWEGTKIEDKYYVNVRPLPWQKVYVNDPFYAPLPIFGATYNSRNAPIVSLFDRGKHWQYLYFAIMHKWIKLIMQDKSVLHTLNLNLLDKEMPMEMAMKYAMELGILPYNPGKGLEYSNTQKVIESFSLSNPNIEKYTNILNYVSEQIGEAMGVTRQREGQYSQYTTATDNQQSIVQSSYITEPEFKLHYIVWKQILEYCVKTLPYISDKSKLRSLFSDSQNAIIDLDKLTPFDEFDLYLEDPSKTYYGLENLRAQIQNVLVNDQNSLDYLISVTEAESLPELKQAVVKIKEEIDQRVQQGQQAEAQRQQQAEEAAMMLLEKEQQHEINLKKIEGEYDLEKAKIDVFKFQQDLDMNNNGVPDPLEVAKLEHMIAKDKKTLELKEKELAIKAKQKSKQ